MHRKDELQGLASFFGTIWYEKIGLYVSLITINIILLTIFVPSGWPPLTIFIILFICSILISGIWFYSRLLPRTPKNKVGVLLAISCNSNDEVSRKIKEDFVRPMKDNIKKSKTGNDIHVFELPQHALKDPIDLEDAQYIRHKCRAHFMIFGSVRKRVIDGVDQYLIDMNGVVGHRPLTESAKNELSRDFGQVLPRQIRISTENDVFSFQFTSEWMEIVAKYVMGMAAYFSGDLDYAERLFKDSELSLKTKDNSFPIYSVIKDKIPIRISELYEYRAKIAHLLWVEDHDMNHIDSLGEYLNHILDDRKKRAEITNLMSIYAFLRHRDVDTAIKYLNEIKSNNDAVWNINMAFLYGYKGDLKRSSRFYRKASMLNIEPDAMFQVEDFMCLIRDEDIDKYQIHYCLGFFNWKLKGDIILARRDFERFQGHKTPGVFDKEHGLVDIWLNKDLLS